MDGYGHESYARALEHLGTPQFLRRARGWLVERPIPGTAARDAMGCYPVFACEDWPALADDLAALDGPIALSLVTDPFGACDEPLLRRLFPDVVLPFKRHFVSDLARPAAAVVSPHHRRNAERALGAVEVERCASPADAGDEWVALYANLVRRHDVRGIAAFPAESLRRQLAVPGAVVYRARHGGETVGAVVWYLVGEVAYYHLGAYSDRGYGLRASFALFWRAREDFRHEARWLALGAAAGSGGDREDGLTRFKKGWATGTRVAWFCGRTLDRERYAAVCAATRAAATTYYPRYRAGEFR